ncbi:MAG: hypothetical protein GZ086_11015 [Gelidibacter sp.]|nr:hypothetical protein [Gelidibacter sp.]
MAQDDDTKDSTKVEVKEQLERRAFEGASLIENPTNVLFDKNTLEVQMQHRFGLIKDKNSLAGIYGDGANIRIALSYAIHDRLTIGYGTTKNNRLQDFFWKAALLRQTRSNSMPVSVTYYGNFAINARPKANFNLVQDRYSYFNQLIIAKRFTPELSLQIAPSISHFNVVDNTMRNDMVAIAFGGRYKISPQTAIIVDYSQPLTKFLLNNPPPGISFGVEFATSAHAFQIFATNYSGIVPQQNYMYNTNNGFGKGEFKPFGKGGGDFLIGFNITRNYNF